MIGEVLSRVDASGELFRDVCYEWEEEVAKYLDVPIRQVIVPSQKPDSILARSKNFIKKIFPAVVRIKRKAVSLALKQDVNGSLSVCFLMFTYEMPVCNGSNCIPIFLDVWSELDVQEVVRFTKNSQLFYVTSRDVYNRVKAISPQSNVHYMPLSIADKYHSPNFAAYRNKTIDVLHSSRKNPVLHEYMTRYVSKHSGLDYVYKENGEYISTLRGNIGRCPSRADYMNLIASAKVCLVGCSGIDGSRADTNGICFPTPRFYESAVSGCALIGRYPDNQEFRELNISRYCPNITSYDQFTRELERALSQTPEELYAQNRDFILNSLTSKRAEQIQHDLEELTCGQSS